MDAKKVVGVVVGLLVAQGLFSQEDDYEFPPPRGWRLAETGEDDASTRLAEGFEGLDAEPGKDTTIEPVDAAGGFDNVAPRLGAEDGPGGLEWDPSPTYRTRYKGSTDYPADSGNRLQGNNWFLRIPYVTTDSTHVMVRFDANTFRVYDQNPYNQSELWGRYGNKSSKIVRTGSAGSYVYSLCDTRGKTLTFQEASPASGRCTKIQGLGGVEVTVSYGTNITVLQKPSATSGNEVRRFTYYVVSNRLDKIEVEEKVSGVWTLYRKLDFTYHEDVTGPVESTAGDLVGIEEQTLLSPASTWLVRKHVFRYYTGTYNASTNPGYPYQVKAVLGPQSVRDWEAANPGVSIYTKTTAQLGGYVDRTYEYSSDKRARRIDFKSGCGCGGGEGAHDYTFAVNGSPPSDLNTWSHRVTITLPDPDGAGPLVSSSRYIDYNKHGQRLNWVAQESAIDVNSRRWILTWRHDTTGRLTDSYSVKACTSYNDSTHVVTTNTTAGMWHQFAYDGYSALSTVKLRDPSTGSWNFQRKKVFQFLTSGDRRRSVKSSETVYPTETTTDTGGVTTSWSYTYHASDALAVKKRTATLPVVATGENGSGAAVTQSDYFETDGLNTWSKDGDGYVHYTGHDAQRRTVTKTCRDVNTSSRPTGVPAPPAGEGFDTTSGLNLVTDFEHDYLRRPTKTILPAFDAWTGSAVASVKQTRQWYYTRLSGGEAVTVGYDHLDSSYFHHALGLTVQDYEGHTVTSAVGVLASGYRDTDLSNDIDTSQATIENAFKWGVQNRGALVRRTDFTYDGSKLTKEEVWSEASGGGSKYTTDHTYDAMGRRLTTKTPAGTITRWSYDVLDRVKTEKLGTVDGGAQDNMTLVEERFYDDEEDTATNVGEGNLTRQKRYTSQGGTPRTTDFTYDNRQRQTQADESLSVRETRTYDNLARVKVTARYDTTSGSVLMAKMESLYDSRGQVYEARTYGVAGGTESGYSNVKTWRNGRGLAVKTQSQGKVFQKTQYDGAGRATSQATSYDAAETAYADADDLTGDTVLEETRFVLDATGATELGQYFQRNHDGTGTGPLDGSSGNARAQYMASWYDKLHRPTHEVSYGTYGGSDMTARPTGNPPSSSSANSLVTRYGYYLEGDSLGGQTLTQEAAEVVDPEGRKTVTQNDDPGHLIKRLESFADWTPGTADDRTTNYTYDSSGRLQKITAKASAADQVTEYVYGVVRGSESSTVSSNDLLYRIKYPDPSTGQPSSSSADWETFGYNALGELVWKKDQAGTEHFYDFDDRGRLIHDRVPTIAAGLDATVRRISSTYDALDRSVKVSSYDNATVGSGAVVNEIQNEYEKFSVVSKIWQDWTGAVTGSSPKVQLAYQFPTDGTTALRRTSTTYPSGTVVTEEYNAGMDDTLSRLSGRKNGTGWLFQETYLGLGRLVERQYGSTGRKWSLLGWDASNNDNYLGLGRFAWIDELKVTNGAELLNHYQYTLNYLGQITFRKDLVGNVSGSYELDEDHTYEGLARLADHRRGKDLTGQTPTIRLHECWTLNRSGSATKYTNGTASSCTPEILGSFNASNEILTWAEIAYSYDDAGNLTSTGSGGYTFKYDAWDQLVEVTQAPVNVSKYKYNGLGQKVKRTDSNSGLPDTYYYYNDAWQCVEERLVSDGSVIYWYCYGTQYIDDMVVRSVSGGSTTQYVVQDARFTTVTRLNYDGTVNCRYCYDSYGKPKQLSADWSTWQTITDDGYLFTGRQNQKDHAQYDYRHRTQDAGILIFAQRDPVAVFLRTDSFQNSYVYLGADPTTGFDPAGLEKIGSPKHCHSLHYELEVRTPQLIAGVLASLQLPEIRGRFKADVTQCEQYCPFIYSDTKTLAVRVEGSATGREQLGKLKLGPCELVLGTYVELAADVKLSASVKQCGPIVEGGGSGLVRLDVGLRGSGKCSVFGFGLDLGAEGGARFALQLSLTCDVNGCKACLQPCLGLRMQAWAYGISFGRAVGYKYEGDAVACLPQFCYHYRFEK
ncbi:MAG: hypothetical protein HY721_24850 [Planctomycetes bacterium]|nr:hypothetical protein [Planctomycetota bacterium]